MFFLHLCNFLNFVVIYNFDLFNYSKITCTNPIRLTDVLATNTLFTIGDFHHIPDLKINLIYTQHFYYILKQTKEITWLSTVIAYKQKFDNIIKNL